MFNLGVPELILILVVGLVVFGPKKLPEIGRSVGKGLREFKKAMNDIKQTIDMESEFKEVAGITKEVTEIKSGLKEVVLGPDVTVNSKVSVSYDQSAATEAGEAEPLDKRGWVNGSNEWTMPEWIESTDNEDAEMETTGETGASISKVPDTSDQVTVKTEKVQL